MHKGDVPPRAKKKRVSVAKLRSWAALAHASYGWNDLTDSERRIWDVHAPMIRSRRRKGRSRRLSGQKYFVKVNAARGFLGQPPSRLPPRRPSFGPNVVGPLRITKGRRSFVLKLSVPSPPGPHTHVWASPPCNAGRRFWVDFRYLCPLPDPHRGQSDISEAYTEKFGNPPSGSRVFIQTRQQLDGFRDLPVQTDALVPGKRQHLPSAAAGE